jgi:hypothetical protein
MSRELVPCEQRILLSGTYAKDDGQYGTISHGYWTNIDVSENDIGGGSYREYSIIQQDSHGFATINMLSGELDFNSYAAWTGQGQIIYQVDVYEDGPEGSRIFIGSDTATVFINATNATPEAPNIDGGQILLTSQTVEDENGDLVEVFQPVTVTYRVDELLAGVNDPDVFETLTLYDVNNGAVRETIDGVEYIHFTFTDGNSPTSFQYTVRDSFNAESTATVSFELFQDNWHIWLLSQKIKTYKATDDAVVNIKLTGHKNTPVQMKIWRDGDAEPAWSPTTTTSTDATGKYIFTHGMTLTPGKYWVAYIVPGTNLTTTRLFEIVP